MFTCFIRYEVEPDRLDEFRAYARSWIGLIRKYGGTHHGYFVPATKDDVLPDPSFSFPGLGKDGPSSVGVALFSFPTVEAYDRYRKDIARDEECIAATARFNASRCFSSYERTFLIPILDGS